MPYIVQWRKYLEATCYVLLLFFVVPIKYDGNHYNLEKEFEQYLRQFNKSYHNKTLYGLRMRAFENSLNTIKELNSNRTNSSAKYGLTKFSDLTTDEFNEMYLRADLSDRLSKNLSPHNRRKRSVPFVLQKKLDWREKKVISPVLNQRNCGACWAFAGISMVESVHAIASKKLEKLSVQQVIDCSEANNGCEGGDVCSLLFWMKESGVKVVAEDKYPLTLNSKKCLNVSSKGVRLKDYGCQSFVTQEDFILHLLAISGPVAVAINAQPWQHYIGGVIQFHCDGKMEDLNHAVTIVGYDLTAKIPHYIIKNSWGEDFGENGYLNVAVGGNICGIAREVSAVTTEDA